MSRFHDAYDTGQDLAPEEKQELACLVDDEWQAAIERGGCHPQAGTPLGGLAPNAGVGL